MIQLLIAIGMIVVLAPFLVFAFKVIFVKSEAEKEGERVMRELREEYKIK